MCYVVFLATISLLIYLITISLLSLAQNEELYPHIFVSAVRDRASDLMEDNSEFTTALIVSFTLVVVLGLIGSLCTWVYAIVITHQNQLLVGVGVHAETTI